MSQVHRLPVPLSTVRGPIGCLARSIVVVRGREEDQSYRLTDICRLTSAYRLTDTDQLTPSAAQIGDQLPLSTVLSQKGQAFFFIKETIASIKFRF